MSTSRNKVFIKIPDIDWEDDASIDAAAAQLWEVIATRLGVSIPAPGAQQGGNCE